MHHYWNHEGDVRCSDHLERGASKRRPGTFVRMSAADVEAHRKDMAAADLGNLPLCDLCRHDELAWMVIA